MTAQMLWARFTAVPKRLYQNTGGGICNIIDFTNCGEFLDYCRSNPVDIVLTDIEMSGGDGFSAVEELRREKKDIAVIFVSANEELALRAYDYQPFCFISKRSLDKLDNVLFRLLAKLDFLKAEDEIFYLSGKNQIGIDLKTTVYLKSSGHYLTAYNAGGGEFKFRYKIQDAYSQLAEMGFIYAHRSYIVNCRHINRFSSKYLELSAGEPLPVSRNKRITEKAKDSYKRFLRRSRL